MLLACFAVAATSQPAQAQQPTVEKSVSTQQQVVKNAAQTQKKINDLQNSTQEMQSKYLSTEQQIDQLKKYNDNLQGLINNQKSNIKSLNKQLGQLGTVAHGIVPLMEQMIAGLQNFIKLDVPYQLNKREQTVQKLKTLMTDSDVTIAERYRQIMSAYQNEIDAGRTISATRGQLTVNGKPQTVDFLRIGRVVLCYQTLDQSQTGCWDQRSRQWKVSNGFRRAVASGLSVARKQTSPSMLILPVPAPVAVQKQSQ